MWVGKVIHVFTRLKNKLVSPLLKKTKKQFQTSFSDGHTSKHNNALLEAHELTTERLLATLFIADLIEHCIYRTQVNVLSYLSDTGNMGNVHKVCQILHYY